ncbi:MAG TPA: hypothetical protein VMS60_15980 [Solirubrobacterales bacterium]|nr:hypothetical protein [Solirubrobacterales bacterium]
MLRASDTFTAELGDVCAQLRHCESRLRALHDLGAYEELPAAVVNRIKNKANAVEVSCSHLEEIPGMLS